MSTFPTSVHSSGRYLLDQNGSPFMVHADSAWSLATQLSTTDIHTYIDDRSSRGFNACNVNLIEHLFADHAPNNHNNDAPFTGTALQSSLNNAYWLVVDDMIDYAATKGMTIFAFVAYLGFNHGTDGWWSELAAASNAQVQSYGQALGNRYKTKSNIVWCVGGDYNPTATEKDRYDHLLQGIQSAGDTHLATGHPQRLTDTASIYGSFSWFTLNSLYSGDPDNITSSVTAYNDTPHRPFFVIEPHYQFRSGFTLLQTRLEQWQPLLVGGIGGHFTGNESIWSFGYNTGIATNNDYAWANHLDDQNIHDAQYIQQFFDYYVGTWHGLAPDLTDVFLTSGEGSGGSTQATASYSTNLGLVYLPAARSITVNMAVFTGHSTMRARWYDPTAGTFTLISASIAASGSHTFTHPGNNSKGDPDWVLAIDGGLETTPTNAIGQATANSAKNTLGPTPTQSSATALANAATATIKPPAGLATATASGSQTTIGAIGPFTRLASATATANSPAATIAPRIGNASATATAFDAEGFHSIFGGPLNALIRWRRPGVITSKEEEPE